MCLSPISIAMYALMEGNTWQRPGLASVFLICRSNWSQQCHMATLLVAEVLLCSLDPPSPRIRLQQCSAARSPSWHCPGDSCRHPWCQKLCCWLNINIPTYMVSPTGAVLSCWLRVPTRWSLSLRQPSCPPASGQAADALTCLEHWDCPSTPHAGMLASAPLLESLPLHALSSWAM